jgi:hypothetical protein
MSSMLGNEGFARSEKKTDHNAHLVKPRFSPDSAKKNKQKIVS